MVDEQPQRGKRKSEAQYKKLGSLLAQEVPVGEALRRDGWSDSQSKKGFSVVPQRVVVTLPKKMQRLLKLGKSTSKEDVEALVSGRLIDNVTKGSDEGAQSAKILGSRKDLGMWQPDVQQGLVVIGQLPSHLEARAKELIADNPDSGKDQFYGRIWWSIR